MTEDEIIAWLTRQRAPIRREGTLTRDEVAEATTAYLNNALNLFEEALLLCTREKVSRAAALTVLGLEELAKVPLLVNTFLRYERGQDPDAWKARWRSGGSHKAKQALILAYGQTIRHLFEGDPMLTRRLYRHYAPDSVLESLDAFKQSSLYVDLRQDGVHEPAGDEGPRNALDYLLAFGQERADSFCSWHISQRRSADHLEVALGRKAPRTWTSHFAVPEVRADILYQAAALSASQVPDYATFLDFAEAYKKKVSDKHFKEALLSLAALLGSRVERSESLPLYYARYLGAFKLMLSLSGQPKLLGGSFGHKLRATLSPKLAAQSG